MAKKLNVKLLRRIQRHIKAEPKRYNQGRWVCDVSGRPNAPSCGTVACIAGWAVLLSTPKKNWGRVVKSEDDSFEFPTERKAKRLLGITDGEAAHLFSGGNQLHNLGKRGVREGCAKIDALIESRK